MSLRDLEIKDSYRSDDCPDLGEYFVSKMLEQSLVYKRAVGFFSSSSLVKLTRGISYMSGRKNAHIFFVVSPILCKEDVEAIKRGYENRRNIITNCLLREFKEVEDEFSCERLNFLCHLIEEGILDIKIADKLNPVGSDDFGIFHEKIGLFVDENNNKVAFTGSLNESDNAFTKNFESVQVFKSWEEPKRVLMIEDDFDRLWSDHTNTLEVYDFPEALKTTLFKYRKATYHKDMDDYEKNERANRLILTTSTKPSYQCPFQLHQYQKDAINKWAHQNFRGLFDMGTGTGKTITALTASVKLLERLNYHLATIIVCPYTHLVEQWVEEETNFNIHFIVGYSDGKYKNYRSDLATAIQNFNDGIISYFYFITTNASYKTPEVQKLLSRIKGNVLFIADEVHNFGAEGLRLALNENFMFRIGLSATIERHRDEEGTSVIRDYFGAPVIHYGLKEAIENDVLTRYYYYPLVVNLDEDEVEKYIDLTNKIRKNSYSQKDGSFKLTKQGEMYALQRARVISVARNKIPLLKKIMEKHKAEHNILVYCGTGKLADDESGDEVRQIDEVSKMLGHDLNMKVATYTSRENSEERKQIVERFKNGDDLQALVAIKCLDEGVNIPSIKTAFILASSTNPREYIQRRGRALRKYPGKTYSYIYDFITLPFPFEMCDSLDSTFLRSFSALAKNEIDRIIEFSSLAENSRDADALINEIKEAYQLDVFEKVNDFERIDWEDMSYDE